MGCHFASLQYCSCPHETMMPIKCDRIGCRGICSDEPERRQCLCLVRYLWSYEGCTMRRIQERYKREFDDTDARETEIIETQNLEAGDVDALLETVNERWEWWQGRLTAQENEMREEIRNAVKWTRRFGTILAGVALPVTEVGKNVISRVIEGKPTEMLVVQDTMHTRAQLMLIQMPPRPLVPWFMKRKRDEQRQLDMIHRRPRLPGVPVFDESELSSNEEVSEADEKKGPTGDEEGKTEASPTHGSLADHRSPDGSTKSNDEHMSGRLPAGNTSTSLSDSRSPTVTSPEGDTSDSGSSPASSCSPGSTSRLPSLEEAIGYPASPRSAFPIHFGGHRPPRFPTSNERCSSSSAVSSPSFAPLDAPARQSSSRLDSPNELLTSSEPSVDDPHRNPPEELQTPPVESSPEESRRRSSNLRLQPIQTHPCTPQ